jgi:molybdopterin/thiamine biosynthesis adenylyltransferase/SAM-dependent methyltransferase
VVTAEETYDAFAPFYDDFTADHDYEGWTADLEELVRRHGLRGRRLLDLACGTGKSFEPFLHRGFEVTACDVSSGMLREARRRAGGRARLVHADVRALPPLGQFDLVLCLDDALNYVLDPRGLGEAFASVARVLAPGGVFAFDLNTLGAYRTTFARDRVVERADRVFLWRGEADAELAAGGTASATIETFSRVHADRWSRQVSRHVERHHPAELVRSQVAAAGLRLAAEHGMTPDGRINDRVDELGHSKRLYVVVNPRSNDGKEVQDAEDREARASDRPGSGDHQGELSGSRRAPSRRARAPSAPPARPRLKPTIDVLDASDGRVYLFRGGEHDYAIERDGRPVAELVRSLDGRRALEALMPELREMAAQLWELGLVEDADDDLELGGEAERYERQLRYFGDLAPPRASRVAYQRRLTAARVVVLGVGGLGGWAAYALAATGVGTLVLVDGDAVEPSNLNRQILYGESDVGGPKAPTAARRLTGFNSGIGLEPIQRMLASEREVREVVRGADFVVDAADQPVHEIERWVNAACFGAGVPYITMSQFPPLVRVGPVYVPGRTGCYACQEAGWRARFPLFDELASHRSARPSPAASFAPASGLVGSLVALEVLHHLTGLCEPATLATSLTIDLRTLEVEREPVERRSGCEVCG